MQRLLAPRNIAILASILLLSYSWTLLQANNPQNLTKAHKSSVKFLKKAKFVQSSPPEASHLQEPAGTGIFTASLGGKTGIFDFKRLHDAIDEFERSGGYQPPVAPTAPQPAPATPSSPSTSQPPAPAQPATPASPAATQPAAQPAAPSPSQPAPTAQQPAQPAPTTPTQPAAPVQPATTQAASPAIPTDAKTGQSGAKAEWFDMNKYWPHELALPFEYFDWANKMVEHSFPSGLKWIHIVDEGVDVVEAGIMVTAGSFDETRGDFPEGTAHLLEHSVNLPRRQTEDPLFSVTNALTEPSYTLYYSQTTGSNFNMAFQVALRDMFKFTPLPDQIRNEINAVDSE